MPKTVGGESFRPRRALCKGGLASQSQGIREIHWMLRRNHKKKSLLSVHLDDQSQDILSDREWKDGKALPGKRRGTISVGYHFWFQEEKEYRFWIEWLDDENRAHWTRRRSWSPWCMPEKTEERLSRRGRLVLKGFGSCQAQKIWAGYLLSQSGNKNPKKLSVRVEVESQSVCFDWRS